jgi:hypothetical protein
MLAGDSAMAPDATKLVRRGTQPGNDRRRIVNEGDDSAPFDRNPDQRTGADHGSACAQACRWNH